MSAVIVWAAIAAIAALVVIATGIIASSRAASVGNQESIGSTPPDPQQQEQGKTQGGPDYARIVQLVALAILIIAVIVLIFLWLG